MEEELRSLLQRYQGGESEAAPELISRLSPLVKGLARRYAGTSSEIEDYYQVGMLGLLKAATRFKTEIQVKFTTFALPWIRGEMLCYRRRTASPVKVSRSLWEQARALTLPTSCCRSCSASQHCPSFPGLRHSRGRDLSSLPNHPAAVRPGRRNRRHPGRSQPGGEAHRPHQPAGRDDAVDPMERKIIVLRFSRSKHRPKLAAL